MGFKDRFGLTRRTVSNEGADDGATPRDELRNFRQQHKWDPFLDNEKFDTIENALDSNNAEKQAAVDESLIQENSPYPEVRAAIPATDEDIPVNTFRAWFLGAILCTVVAACNVLLSMHRTSAAISSVVVQLVAYPMGVGLANVLPDKTFSIFGRSFNLNPGPFNVKEHTIITIMTAAGSAYSYAIDILLAQEVFYKQHFGWGFQILLIMSTQAMGFGLAGITRRFLIYPSSMVWPANLVTCTIMHTLHRHVPADPSQTHGWSISRYKFFIIVSSVAFVYHWIPEVFAQFLNYFNFACWIAPNNVVVNQLFGAFSGVGMLPITFDWLSVSSWLGSPLQSPLFAILNVGSGLFLCFIAAIGLTYAGPEFYKYLPLSANANFDRYAEKYNTSLILTESFTVNETAYAAYSPILIGATFSMAYCMSFATLISTLVHCGLFYGPEIWKRSRNSKYDEPDVHQKLMQKYKEAPEWWFLVIFTCSFAFGMLTSQVWSTHLPWWAYIVCILMAVVFIIPIGIVQAVTNQQPGLNVITEMVFGYMLPGRPVAMMLFKSWGYMTAANGLNYISDMKIGHYMKIPPRSMFAAQAFAVIWLSLVQIATYNFVMGNINEVCTENQKQGLICPNAVTFYNASVIWGVIGPKRVFGSGGIFAWTNWFWFIGTALPVIQFFVAKKYPRSWVRFVVFPAIFGACGLVPPATLYVLFPWVIVGVIFNGWIRRRYFGWWTEYNYVLSGALDIGARMCVVIVALALGLSAKDFPEWWGNTVIYNTLDAKKKAVTKTFIPNVTEPIGPSHW